MSVVRERVTNVIDGDTFDTPNRRVRLAGVDTPERGQPGYEKAKQALTDLIGGQVVDITIREKDRYGRDVAEVMCNGIDVNETMKQYE